MNKQLTENKVTHEQNSSIENCSKIINNLIGKDKQLTKRVQNLENKVKKMEQNSREYAVKIYDVPIKPNKDVLRVKK